MTPLLSLLGLLACGSLEEGTNPEPDYGGTTTEPQETEEATGETDDPVDTGDPGPTDTEDTEDTENRGTMLEGACKPPSPLPEDPITERGSLEDKDVGKFYELTDLEVCPEQDLAGPSGQGGLLFFDISPSNEKLISIRCSFKHHDAISSSG